MSGTLAIVHAPGVNQAQLNTLVEKLRDFIDHMDFKGADIQVNPDIHLKSEKYDNKDEIITLIVGWGLPFKPTQGWWMNEIPISKTVRQFIAIDLFERNRFDGRELNPPKINAGKYWSRKTRRENFRLFLEGFYIKPTAPYAMRRVPTKKSKKIGRYSRFIPNSHVVDSITAEDSKGNELL